MKNKLLIAIIAILGLLYAPAVLYAFELLTKLGKLGEVAR